MPFLQVSLCALVFLNLELLACYKFLATSAMNGIGDDGTDCKVLNHLFTRSSSSYLSRKQLILLCFCFIVLHRYADTVFLKSGRFEATLNQASLLVLFLQRHLLTLCLCHILLILKIFQSFKLLLYLFWGSALSDLQFNYCNCFGVPRITFI